MTRDEWDRLPKSIKDALLRSGIGSSSIRPSTSTDEPYTRVGATSLKGTGDVKGMNPGIGAVTFTEGLNDDGTVPASTSSFIAYNPSNMQDKKQAQLIKAHEMEHVLENQSGGQKIGVNERWNALRSIDAASRPEMVERIQAALPYLQKEWGLPTGLVSSYFEKDGDKKTSGLMLNELFATLSALEQQNNRRLTQDPYMRKNVFKSDGDREIYNAITGLRQTRLDAKDLPPNTRQPEPRPDGGSWLNNLRAVVLGE